MSRSSVRIAFTASVSLVLALMADSLSYPVNAATITVGTPGGSVCSFACGDRYQQFYSASNFTGGAMEIREIAFLVSRGGGTGGWASEWQMSLSTVANGVTNMTNVFPENIGADNAIFDVVKFGTGGNSPTNAGDVVKFDGHFLYDPSRGDLLIDLLLLNGSIQGPGFVGTHSPGLVRALWPGGNPSDLGFFTTFTFEGVSPVPLPAALPLFATILAGGGLIAWRRKRRKLA